MEYNFNNNCCAIFLFIILRPVSKKELKKFEDKDNWSNMGF